VRTISLHLDDATDARLRQICARTRQSQTEAIKAAIMAFPDREGPTPAESAAELGLIGAFDSGVGDLGRNHASHLRARLAAKHLHDQVAG
jgi:hypothetical protein